MGDRANIVIKQNAGNEHPGRIYFYTHWSGDSLPVILQSALKRGRQRWDDEPYLGRIIFNEMTKGDEMELTGFGISTYETDGGYALLVVDAETQTVSIEGGERYGGGQTIPFADYCDISFDGDDCSAWDTLAKRLAS